MDVLYYSNFCKHSQKIIQYISKGNLADKLHCICIDKRTRDPNTGQLTILLESGKRMAVPPNVHSVPALLLVNQNYSAIFGDEIIRYFEPKVKVSNDIATNRNGEPMAMAYPLGNSHSTQGYNIVSEQYTYYDMSPEELSAKGNGGMRQMYNYVSAAQDTLSIQTPPDTYRPDRIDNSVTIDKLEEKRNTEIHPDRGSGQNPLFL